MAGPAPASRPDLSVVVVNYNAGEYLGRCVASVFSVSSGIEAEVLVVDNASHDGSAVAAARREPRMRLIANPENRGLSAAWNQGARETSAPWILFLNPDAEVSSGELSTFLKVAGDRPDVAVVGPLIRNPDGSIYESGRVFPTVGQAVGHAFLGPFRQDNRFSRAYRQSDWDRRSEREVDWVSGAAMLVRRSAFEEIGRFDEGFWLYGEELDLSTRLRAAGWSVLFSAELGAAREGGLSTGRGRRMAVMHSMSIYRYYTKHRARGWRRVLLPFARIALRARAELVALRQRRSGA